MHEAFRKLRPGVPLAMLHGKMRQGKRLGVFYKFNESKAMALFATDIAARGLDFPAVDWVVQVPASCLSFPRLLTRLCRCHTPVVCCLRLTGSCRCLPAVFLLLADSIVRVPSPCSYLPVDLLGRQAFFQRFSCGDCALRL